MGVVFSSSTEEKVTRQRVSGAPYQKLITLSTSLLKCERVLSFLELRDILSLKCSNSCCHESVKFKDFHIKAFDALFTGTGCFEKNCSNEISVCDSGRLGRKSSHHIKTMYCWKFCISHVYQIQTRFALSNTVVSTALAMLDYILKSGSLPMLSNVCTAHELDVFETLACILCFISSKYEDVAPLSLNSIKYYSCMRIVPDFILSFELRVLSIVDPSVSMRGHNSGMFLDALYVFYTQPLDNLAYKAFFKVGALSATVIQLVFILLRAS